MNALRLAAVLVVVGCASADPTPPGDVDRERTERDADTAADAPDELSDPDPDVSEPDRNDRVETDDGADAETDGDTPDCGPCAVAPKRYCTLDAAACGAAVPEVRTRFDDACRVVLEFRNGAGAVIGSARLPTCAAGSVNVPLRLFGQSAEATVEYDGTQVIFDSGVCRRIRLRTDRCDGGGDGDATDLEFEPDLDDADACGAGCASVPGDFCKVPGSCPTPVEKLSIVRRGDGPCSYDMQADFGAGIPQTAATFEGCGDQTVETPYGPIARAGGSWRLTGTSCNVDFTRDACRAADDDENDPDPGDGPRCSGCDGFEGQYCVVSNTCDFTESAFFVFADGACRWRVELGPPWSQTRNRIQVDGCGAFDRLVDIQFQWTWRWDGAGTFSYTRFNCEVAFTKAGCNR